MCFFKKNNPLLETLQLFGYKKDSKNKNKMVKKEGNTTYSVSYSGKWFWIDYEFNKDLEEQYHDTIFENIDKEIVKLNSELEIGCLGFEFIQAIINHKKHKNLTADRLILLINTFFKIVKEELAKNQLDI